MGGAECSITERGISRESRTSSILRRLRRQRRGFITLGAATFLPLPTQHMAMAARGRAGGGGGRGSFHHLSASAGLVLLLPARKTTRGSAQFLINRYSAVQCRDSRTKPRPSVAWLRPVTQQDAEASLRRLFLWAVYMLDW